MRISRAAVFGCGKGIYQKGCEDRVYFFTKDIKILCIFELAGWNLRELIGRETIAYARLGEEVTGNGGVRFHLAA